MELKVGFTWGPKTDWADQQQFLWKCNMIIVVQIADKNCLLSNLQLTTLSFSEYWIMAPSKTISEMHIYFVVVIITY